MRKLFLLTSIIISSKLLSAASVVPEVSHPSASAIIRLPQRVATVSLRIAVIQKMLKRKLTLKEKIELFILKHAMNRRRKEGNKGGSAALILGIAGPLFLIIGLLAGVPILFLGAAIPAILAIVLGSIAKKGADDSRARTGVLLGWITLAVEALLILCVVIFLSTFFNW